MAGAETQIVALDGHTRGADGNSWSILDPLDQVVVFDRSTPEEVLARAWHVEVSVTNKAIMSAAAIDPASQLRLLAVTAPGYDCVDVAAARRRGVPVVNVPEYGTRSVAQLTFALLLELACYSASSVSFAGRRSAAVAGHQVIGMKFLGQYPSWNVGRITDRV